MALKTRVSAELLEMNRSLTHTTRRNQGRVVTVSERWRDLGARKSVAGCRERCKALGRLSGKLPARIGLTCLYDDGPSLWRTGDIERTPYGQFRAFMVEDVHLRRIEEGSAFDIADKGVVVEAIPQAGDNVIEFARTFVAFAMGDMRIKAEIQCSIGIGRRDDVPPGASAANSIESIHD